MGDSAKGYLHGYSSREQQRLSEQARFLEDIVYQDVDFSSVKTVLEVGCGVGAQTEILLERFPHLNITAVDSAPEQIAVATKRLNHTQKRVELLLADALHLPFLDNSFDAAFVCFFLEHVGEPTLILKEIQRVLKPGGLIYCTEVQNATFFLYPHSPATMEFWNAFNRHQIDLGGDPYVGAKLGNLLLAAGFQNVSTATKIQHLDNRRTKARTQWLEYWSKLLLSGAPELLKAGLMTEKKLQLMTAELDQIKRDPEAVFFYGPVQARGQAL